MLDNEFDQIFRDRLLDHPSMVRQGLWKQLHTHLVRHNAFLKWYFVGPSTIAAAVGGYFLLTAITTNPATSKPPTAAANTRSVTAPKPAAPKPVTIEPATIEPATAASVSTAPAPTSTAPASTASAPTTPVPAATSNAPVASAETSAGSAPTAIATASANSTSAKNRHHRPNPVTSEPAADSGLNDLTNSAAAGQPANPAITANANGTANADAGTPHPPIPARLTAPAKLVTLKTHPDVAARTSNPKNPHQLILPDRKHHRYTAPPIRVEAFSAPEFFTVKAFGTSINAGARVTAIFKKHWTLTTGLEYLRLRFTGKSDNFQTIQPGDIENLHIPILIGYTTNYRQFSFSANAGVLVSAYAHAEGEMTNYSYYWPSRNGTVGYLGIDFGAKLSDKTSFFAQPYVKTWSPPYLYPFPEGPIWSTGIMLGLRYGF